MTPLQTVAYRFPDQNAIVRRIGNLNVYLCVKANPERTSGAWVATVELASGKPRERWTRDEQTLALRQLMKLVNGVGFPQGQKTARGAMYVGLERPLTKDELAGLTPPFPSDAIKVEDAHREDLATWRKLCWWWACLWARVALGQRVPAPPALPPAKETRADDGNP